MSFIDDFKSATKLLDEVSSIANNPSSLVDDLVSKLHTSITPSSMDNIVSSLGDLAHSPTVDGLTSILSDSVNSLFKDGNISSITEGGLLEDPHGYKYELKSSIANINSDDVNKSISKAMAGLTDSGILSDSVLNKLDTKTIGLTLDRLSNSLTDLFGDDYVGWSLTNNIMEQISGTLNDLHLTQTSPEATTFQAEQCPALNLTGSDIALNDIMTANFQGERETRDNPLDPTATPGDARPNDRHNTPIGVEPVHSFNGRYPYNKAHRSESGHLKEIDDTPGHERLLDQHASGTYQEMHANGDHVIKVVGSNYTAVAGSDKISIEGDAHVYVKGTCRLHIGGAITIVADGGLNFVSKGDFRVKAKSINLESVTGDINIKSGKNTLIDTKNDMHITSKTNHIDSSSYTSMEVGSSMSVDAKAISMSSAGPITAVASSDMSLGGSHTYIHGSDGIDVLADGSNINVDGSQTNVQTGQAAGLPRKPDKTVPAQKSYGSSINYAPDPAEEIMANDDDPEAMAQAIQTGLKNGTISQDSLKAPGSPSESDTNVKDNGVTGDNTVNLGNIGPTPSDNLALSKHYKLGDLTKNCHFPHAICAQHGLTVSQIAGNLQLVAVNILEKIRVVYPDVFITSAFRPGNGKSQHQRGMAVDMQFHNGSTPKRCLNIAQWIKENVAFDQLILEYSSPSTCWIHCSYNSAGNRPASDSTKVMTMYGGKYTPGLHEY